MDARIDQQVPRRGQVQRGQDLAHAFRPGIPAADEDRNVRPELQAQPRQPVRAQLAAPQMVQRHQHRRGVGRSATEAAPGRNAFFDADIRTLTRFGEFLQKFGSLDDQIVILGHTGD